MWNFTFNKTSGGLLLQQTERKENRQRWTKSSIKQIKNKNKIATNKRARMNVLVRPAKLGYDRKKALPSQPAQTWPPFLHHGGGHCSLHFHHRPLQNYSSIEPERHNCATQTLKGSLETVSKKSLECVCFLFNFNLACKIWDSQHQHS